MVCTIQLNTIIPGKLKAYVCTVCDDTLEIFEKFVHQGSYVCLVSGVADEISLGITVYAGLDPLHSLFLETSLHSCATFLMLHCTRCFRIYNLVEHKDL